MSVRKRAALGPGRPVQPDRHGAARNQALGQLSVGLSLEIVGHLELVELSALGWTFAFVFVGVMTPKALDSAATTTDIPV